MKENDMICDDRGVLELAQKIRAMSDEEFEEYMKERTPENSEHNHPEKSRKE